MAEDLPSKTQLDKLGDRLRQGGREEVDLRALDDYRRSFRVAYEQVMQSLAIFTRLERTGRPAKTTNSIADKLRRQRIRLTQIQDIAGVRLICNDAADQDVIVSTLPTLLKVSQIDDRRKQPSHGYRAVHVIVGLDDRHVEVQVRTMAQHQWAEVSEKLADLLDPTIKYGGGPAFVREGLSKFSETVKICEELERQHRTLLDSAGEMRIRAADALVGSQYAKLKDDAEHLIVQVQEQRTAMENWLKEISALLLKSVEKERDDFSN